ncbi:MAG: DUF3619 family protein [Gallionellaceae bacterium]|jgi:hypothetical protein
MDNINLTTNSIKRLLNQSVTQLDAAAVENLRAARNRTLESHRALQHTPVLAWLNHHGVWVGSPSSNHKFRSWAFALAFAACLLSGAAYIQQLNEHDHSEIDIAILADDLPVDAYVEQ